jgi:two-component system phosphate regulon sensor histidine kinase PhoR
MVVILKQKRLSDIQKDFINNMTHEFKTPISTIQITCDLIDKPEVIKNSELVLNYNSIIRKEAYRLKEHVDRVLEIAFMEKGKVKYNITQIHLHHCIDIAVKSITVLLGNKNGNILLQLDALYDEIYGDEVHIINVIFNLLDNAIKYSINAPNIKVRTKNIDNEIYISIFDNGIGIALENRKKIFDKFYRVPTGNIHNVKGFGLGLFYVHTIIKLHKGKVVVNNNFPVGTEFLIRLPLGRKKL